MTARDHVSYHCLINGVIPEKGIELVHSKEVAMESAARRVHRDNAVMYSEDVSHNRTSSRINANTGRTLDKGIQLYRLWFRYLKLALELEEMKVSLVIKNEFLDKRHQNVPEEVRVRIRKQFAERKLKVDASDIEGLTPPNSPKYCKSCMLFAGLIAIMVCFIFTQK